MINLKSAIIFCLLASFCKADYCQDNFTLAEFPEGILDEALSLIITGTISSFAGCPENVVVPPSDVKFRYFSRSNQTVPILIDPSNPTQIDPSKKTIMLIPGWLCNVTNDRMPELTVAYLQRYDANIIGIDWTAQSIALYTESFCAIPKVAEIIGAFLCSIGSTSNVDLAQLHVLGHSMGAQIAGLTGQEVQKQCGKLLDRITGLDPAGPLYQLEKESERLSATDARFVDVIHSNMAFLGFYGPMGTVDFFPNCGTFQPGCMKIDRDTSISDILNLPISVVGCNHLRSIDYFIESINSPKFQSRSCLLCPGAPIVGPCVSDIFLPSFALMGEDCPRNSEDSRYNLKTNSQSPFAKG